MIFHSLRLDGIEESPNTVESDYVLPFRASAFQFHRYKLLMELFLPSQPDLLSVDESLTLVEKCLLHKMLSSSVRPWERGDESVVCPLSAKRRQTMTRQSSTRYGKFFILVLTYKSPTQNEKDVVIYYAGLLQL